MSNHTILLDTKTILNGAHTIEAVAADAAGNTAISPKININVNNAISVNEKSITILNPNGGEIWKSGKAQTIRWKSLGVTSPVRIELLKDSTNLILFNSTNNTESISWFVLPHKSRNCKIKISSIENPSIYGISSDFFRIN